MNSKISFLNSGILCAVFAAFCLAGAPMAGYKSPTQLKAEFNQLLGPGKHALLVWQREGRNMRKPNFDLSGNHDPSSLWVMDTKDCVPRQLVAPLSGTRSHYSAASFTADGKRIIYTEGEAKKIHIVNWDGTGNKVLLDNYDGDGRTWRSPDGKNWVLATQIGSTKKLQRINVDNPSDKVDIVTATWSRPDYNAGYTCWAMMSPDGKYVTAGFPNYGELGILEIATGKIRKWDPSGCWPNISQDDKYNILYVNAPGEHREIRIIDKNFEEVKLIDIRSLLKKPSSQDAKGGAIESLRWTRDPDYVTWWHYYGYFISDASTPNPCLVRLSDLKQVALDDDPEGLVEGNMDVYFYTDNTRISLQHNLKPVTSKANAGKNIYDFQGRILNQSKKQPTMRGWKHSGVQCR